MLKPSSAAPAPAAAAEDVARLLAARAGLPVEALERIDTHAASIFLAGTRAWKLKRPVRLPYLDFSTSARRRRALEAELRLNRRTAPDLYVAVHALTRATDGALVLDGDTPPIDHILEMHRFAADALLADRAAQGWLAPELVDRLADMIAGFHARAPLGRRDGGGDRLAQVIDGNAACLAAYPALCPPDIVASLLAAQRAALARHAARLDARARAGRVRHCHGDLHLANIALIGEAPVPFDCLEFDDELATSDVLYDLAFLLMDLWVRGLRDEANRLFNRYLDRSPADEDGVALLPLLLSLRATVRAHVAAARAVRTGAAVEAEEARALIDAAATMLSVPAPRLVAIGGRSGTGKSTLARALGAALGAAPGARILRSDVLRKRLAGIPAEARLAPAAYTAEASRAVYAELERIAGAHLAAGASVVADAAFLNADERDAIRALAEERCIDFAGLWLELSLPGRLARVAGRGRDASDADASVVRLQARRPVGALGGWHRLRATGGTAELGRRARHVLGLA